MSERTYIAIDLKSFYASVECQEREVDALTTNLVVADITRTEKTICLAVSPALKAYGIPGRARLFEVVQKVKEINAQRLLKAPAHKFTGKSYDAVELANDPSLELDYIVAPPRMSFYMDYSTRIVDIYLKYVSMDDMHVYSIDEVFMDATDYIRTRNMAAHDFARMIVQDVLQTTGITATAGIGTNLYLCKIAMDIYAKHTPADKDGVRIAELNEMTYRQYLWDHRPLTDFWRIGHGYARKLEANEMFTMGDIARCSLGGPNDTHNEALLYKLFGINAELLIDHAWGWESCTIKEIKAYRPQSNSLSVGQVLQAPYSFDQAKIIIREMTDGLILDLVEKGLVTDQIVLSVGYDISSASSDYGGPVETDWYGRKIPKGAHGSKNLGEKTSSTKKIMAKTIQLFDEIVDKKLFVRRMYVVANHIVPASSIPNEPDFEQMDMFTDYDELKKQKEAEATALEKEKCLQKLCYRSKGSTAKTQSFMEQVMRRVPLAGIGTVR